MPVIGEVDQIVVPVHRSSAGDVPGCLDGCLAQQRAAELDVLSAAPVDVMFSAMETGMVDEHPVHSVNKAMEVSHLDSRFSND